jgi:hypothetical protein
MIEPPECESRHAGAEQLGRRLELALGQPALLREQSHEHGSRPLLHPDAGRL